MGEFILKDFRRDITGMVKSETLRTLMFKWLGHAVIACPFEAHTIIDFTGPPGSCSGLFHGIFFQLGKWEYQAKKADEWIEVSPVHQAYYALTQREKESLETRIKTGLTSATQAVADFELVMHDERKYREFLEYFGYRTKRDIDKLKKKKPEIEPKDYDELFLEDDENEIKKRLDNHSLKAVFIDQVDIHTGEGISMRSIVSRWPTLISDFMRLKDTDLDVNKIMSDLDVSRAEAVVLVTKNKLFLEWKNLFGNEVKNRYRRIRELVRSKQETMDQYRKWLEPVIARHKMLKEGLEAPSRRAEMLTFPLRSAGHATSSAMIELWAWKDFSPAELYKGGTEDIAKLVYGTVSKMKLTPYDRWTKNNLIFNKDHGLILEHEWVTDEWVKQQLDEFYKTGWLIRNKLYYSFFIITLNRTNIRDPTGAEIEDGMFDVNLIVMSQNVLFTKLLELKARQEELNMHIDRLLGLPHKILGAEKAWKKEKDYLAPVKKFLDKISFGMKFSYRGYYEKNFFDRLANVYFSGIVGVRYNAIVNFIKEKIGMGK
jgi:hypothetical protein